ncbi:MAG: hypothetical protein H6712_23285 [Myxococcales bacterium]|nr:hypothetical protein [Myxococcales bacterium]MCB9716801.1 hypothetical protein [Myxococcales bacterium]
MLTLTGATSLDGLTVYRDVVLDGERARTTSRVHVLGNTPRLVQHDDGWPAIWITRYRGAAGERESIGAVLMLTVELAPTEDELAALREALGAEVEPMALDVVDGTITLSVVGSSGGDELVRSISGPRRATFIGNQRASFLVELSADGSALLDQVLERELPAIHVGYELSFRHVVSGLRIQAWADLAAATTVLADRSAVVPPDSAAILGTIRERQLTGVAVEVLDPAVDEETVERMRDVAQQAVDAAVLGSLLGPPDEHGNPTILHPPNERLDMRISQGLVLTATTGVTGLLSLRLPEEAGRIRLVETARETRLDVTMHCTVDFASTPIDAVLVHWELPSTGAHDVLRFDERNAELRFRTLKGSEPRWRYRVDVWLDRRTEPLSLPWTETTETLVVLDLDGVGYLDVELRLETLALVAHEGATVELEHPALDAPGVAILDPAHPRARWTPVVAEHPARPWRSRVTWLGRDGSRSVGEWEERSARSLVLVPPEVPVARSEVLLISVGSFDDLVLVLCALRQQGAERSDEIEIRGSGESHSWSSHAERPWEYQLTRVRPDGTREVDPWQPGDDPVVVVRDPFAAVVTVLPQALQATPNWVVAQVLLRPVGAVGTTLLTFRRGDPERVWRFRSPVPDQLAYEYRRILVTPGAPRVEGEWTPSSSPVLVLRPPAQPSPAPPEPPSP